jgi:hypothetical protein
VEKEGSMSRICALLSVCAALGLVVGCIPEKKDEPEAVKARPAAAGESDSAIVPVEVVPTDTVSMKDFRALEARVTALEAGVAAGAGIVSGAASAVPVIGIPNKSRNVWKCVKVKKGPRIDGKLDDPAWKQALQAQLVSNKGGRLANDTVVAICHDGEKFYLGAIALESEMDKLKITCTKRDEKVWKDDCYEIYFDENRDREDAVKVCVNPNGVFMDFVRQSGGDGDDVSWNMDVKTAKLKDRWVMEMSFPIKDMKVDYKPGLAINFNIMRMRHGNGKMSEYSTWWGKINRINSLGKMEFE